MPDEYVEYGRSWERLHPGWEVRTWGEDDLDWLENRAEFDRAQRFTTKSNIARYEIVHREGGVYVDCDFEALRPIDELLEDASLVVGEERSGRFNNALFAATPGHPVLRYAIDELPRSFAGRFEDLSIASTGPGFWTRCVRRASVKYDLEPTVLTRDQIYPYGFEPGQRHLRHADFGEAYAAHHWADDQRLVTPAPEPTTSGGAPALLRREVEQRIRDQLKRRVGPRVAALGRRLAQLPGPWVWGTYVGNNRVLVRTARGVPMLAFADDLGVTPTLLADGDYDVRFLRFLRRELGRGDVAVDVGANIGLFAVEMARCVGQSGRVFAYEPNPEVHDLLVDNVYLNRVEGTITGDVTCRPVAVGSGADGSGTLQVRAKHRGMGSLITPDAGPAPGEPERHEVAIVDLDHELRGITEIRLVKIDVEGGELGVLRGMGRLLRERRVRLVDLELVDRHAGATWDDLAETLRGLRTAADARFHTIGAGGELRPIDLEGALHQSQLGHLVISLPGG